MASTSPTPEPGDTQARARGWQWLASLPRRPVPHGDRGADPLAPVCALLDALGRPERTLRVIHVVGSKGKGSTALFAEQLLLGLGQRTFTFTSPHLERWTERLRLDGAEIDGATGLRALAAVQQAAATMGIQPGFFEALTVAGLWLAREQQVDWCVIEAGVGGRADATNVIQPRALVLTSIELEHTDRLGTTLGAIVREKAGAIKPGTRVIHPPLPAEAAAVVARAIEETGAEALLTHSLDHPPPVAASTATIRWQRVRGQLRVTTASGTFRLPFVLPGDAMAGNAALALAAVHRLGLASHEALQRSARRWHEAMLPGRLETLSRLPWIMIDGAHTRASTTALAMAVRDLAPASLTLVLSLSGGRDIHAVTEPLLALAERVIATRADPDHSLAADDLAAALRARWPETPIDAIEDPGEALADACQSPATDRLILATGSVYLAGGIRALCPASSI